MIIRNAFVDSSCVQRDEFLGRMTIPRLLLYPTKPVI